MTFIQILAGFVLVLVALIGLVVLSALVKKSKASTLVTVSKLTEDGESIVFNTNFSASDSREQKKAKMDELLGLAEERMAFVQKRFLDKIEEQKKAQAQGKVAKLS